MRIAASAPASLAWRVRSIAAEVLFEPVPASTGTRPRAAATTTSTTRRCSAWESVAASPVEPQGTRPSTPAEIWSSTRSWSARSSMDPSRNGVTSAVRTPSNMFASVRQLAAHPLGARPPWLPPSVRLDLDPTREDAGRGAGHHDRRVVALPRDLELAAAQRDAQPALRPSAEHARDRHRAGAAPAGERLARAALPGALPDPVPRHDL